MPGNSNFKALIIGHGIAGAMLAWAFHKKGIDFKILDKNEESTSSKVSSGLINPITGRYFARSWMVDTVMPFAEEVYREIENDCDINFLKKTEICRILTSVAQENEWASKSQRPEYAKYMSFWEGETGLKLENVNNKSARISPVFQLQTARLIEELGKKWKESGLMEHGTFEAEKLIRNDNFWEYGSERYNGVIFCEGHQVANNPFFHWLPIEPTKGEVMLVKIDPPGSNVIVKHHCFIIPWEDDLYWIGSNYEKYPSDSKINLTEQSKLEERLSRSVANNYTIIERWSGIRPASRDRRPTIGEHPEHEQLFVFNGLGTKGTVYAPYFAFILASHIIDKDAIPDEVSINRWLTAFN